MSEMTSLERVLTTVALKEPDRVPVFPVLLMQGARELGLPLPEYFTRGEALARGQLALLERYGHDCVLGVPHVVQDAAAFGCGLIYFDDGPPSVDRMVLRSFDEASSLQAPDPADSDVLRPTFDALEGLATAVKGKVPILGACIAPFSLPSMLMGTDRWMQLLFESPSVRDPLLNHLMEVATTFVVSWANLQLERGADIIVLADGMASASVIFRNQFEELALPVVRETIAAIQGPVVYEGVGSLQPFIDLLPDTGAAAIILDCHDDLAACKEAVGDRVTLVGNLNNVAMVTWTVEEMRRQAESAIQAGGDRGGYILSAQGPEIPWDVPDEVIQAMVLAPRVYRARKGTETGNG